MPDIIPASEIRNALPGTTVQYWAMLRHKGGGPVYTKAARKVYYRRSDVNAWLESSRYTRPDRPVETRPQDNHQERRSPDSVPGDSQDQPPPRG